MEKEIEKFFKLIPDINKKALDYDALIQEGFPMNVVICERMLRIKTYGAKSWTYDQWDKSGRKNQNTLWVRNLADDLAVEQARFLDDIPPWMNDLQIEKIKGDNSIKDNDGNRWLTFGAVSTPRTLRGSRRYLKYIVWDEFNDSTRYLGNEIVPNFLNLLSSSKKMLKSGQKSERVAFILGNNRSINHPLFVELGISHIDQEVTRVYSPNGLPLMLILCPILSNEELKNTEEDMSQDWEYWLAKMTGNAGHIFFNMSQMDEVNSIHSYWDISPKSVVKKFINQETILFNDLKLKLTCQVDGNYLNFYHIPEHMRSKLKATTHIVNVTLLSNEFNKLGIQITPEQFVGQNKKGKPIVYVSNPLKQKTGQFLFNNSELMTLREMLSTNLYSFENISSKDLFYKLLNKK